MTVRRARNSDIPAIVDLLQSQFRKSHYHGKGIVEIDQAEAKRLLVTAIQRHGHTTPGGCFVEVAETDGMITGLIVGTLTRVYAIGSRLMASDLFWVANGNVDPRDPERLMRNMVEWAWSSPYVVEVVCGATKVVTGNPRRAGRILERIGMKEYGLIYRAEKPAQQIGKVA